MTSRHDQQPRTICDFGMTPVTSSSLVPTSTSNESHTRSDELPLVPDTQSNESHTRSDELPALVPDSALTVAINRGQATTVLSEHHNKEQRKRTQRRSATMFAVFLLCVLRAHFRTRLTPVMGCAHAWMSGRAYESSLSMSRRVYRLKTTSAVLWQCGWSGPTCKSSTLNQRTSCYTC